MDFRSINDITDKVTVQEKVFAAYCTTTDDKKLKSQLYKKLSSKSARKKSGNPREK